MVNTICKYNEKNLWILKKFESGSNILPTLSNSQFSVTFAQIINKHFKCTYCAKVIFETYVFFARENSDMHKSSV